MGVKWMFASNFQGGALGVRFPMRRRSVLENGFHFPDGPAFLGPYHAHLSTAADQRVRTDLIVDGQDRELGFRLSVEGKVEVAREDPPSRAVIEFDDVALGMGPDFHGAFMPRRRAQWRRPIGYFCPDGACAFELLGSGLLAS